jgi:AcrR family transcriptional regulator
MARTDSRGGQETKARIAQAASRLFAERGFEDVTVAEVGQAAGVSSVTVFKYFSKKEDMFFDRSDEISDLFAGAVRGHRTRHDVRDAILVLLHKLLDQQHPLSGVDKRSVDFFRTVAASPTLTARARHLAAAVQDRMVRELDDVGFDGDSALVAAFLIAGYTRILTETVTDLTAGSTHATLVERHRASIKRLLGALDTGVL